MQDEQEQVKELIRGHIIDELREICADYGLTVSGNKQTLAERIVEYRSWNPQEELFIEAQRTTDEKEEQLLPSTRTSSNVTGKRTTSTRATMTSHRKREPIPKRARRESLTAMDRVFSIVTTHLSTPYTPRIGHSSVTYQDTKIVVFGGESSHGQEQLLNSVAVFDTTNNAWSTRDCTGSIPSRRMHHRAVLAQQHYMYVFGGQCDSGCSNELYRLDLMNWNWTIVESPSDSMSRPEARCAHSFVVMDELLLVFGGYDAKHEFVDDWTEETTLENTIFKDVWVFQLQSKEWKHAPCKQIDKKQPHKRCFHAAAVHGRDMYVTGGVNLRWPELFDGPFDDMWKWNADTLEWTCCVPSPNIHTSLAHLASYAIGKQPKEMHHPVVVSDEQYIYVFNDQNFTHHFVYRYSFERGEFKPITETEEEHTSSIIHRFQFRFMSANLIKNNKIYLHGAFQESSFCEDLRQKPLDKDLVVFWLDRIGSI